LCPANASAYRPGRLACDGFTRPERRIAAR
jgi:hypothetical protein